MSMATTRLLRTSRTSTTVSSSSSSCSFSNSHNSCSTALSMRLKKVGPPVDGEKRAVPGSSGGGERKLVAVTAAVATSENAAVMTKTQTGGVDLALLVEMVKVAGIRSLKVATRKRPWRFIIQMFIEKVIIDCRFFAMFAVAGSLLGSVLCFVEGCFMIVQSYLQYFNALSLGSDQGHVIQLLIEAIDMFLVGTAMLIFGMGLHVMFVGSRNLNGKGSHLHLPPSNFFGLFYLRKLPSWVGIGSITEAKSKIGHALMMILQVGMLEKFKSIPMASGLDLACFAGAVFVSSACIFLLSRLSFSGFTAHP